MTVVIQEHGQVDMWNTAPDRLDELPLRGQRHPLAYAVDVMLALDDDRYTPSVFAVEFGASGLTDLTLEGDYEAKARRLVQRLRREKIPTLFLTAAKSAADGRLAPELCPHLARVRFLPGDGAEVHDFAALAAWSLDQAMRQRRFDVRPCANCQRPFLASEKARYCLRPAPQTGGQSCRDYAKVRDHRARQRKGDT